MPPWNELVPGDDRGATPHDLIIQFGPLWFQRIRTAKGMEYLSTASDNKKRCTPEALSSSLLQTLTGHAAGDTTSPGGSPTATPIARHPPSRTPGSHRPSSASPVVGSGNPVLSPSRTRGDRRYPDIGKYRSVNTKSRLMKQGNVSLKDLTPPTKAGIPQSGARLSLLNILLMNNTDQRQRMDRVLGSVPSRSSGAPKTVAEMADKYTLLEIEEELSRKHHRRVKVGGGTSGPGVGGRVAHNRPAGKRGILTQQTDDKQTGDLGKAGVPSLEREAPKKPPAFLRRMARGTHAPITLNGKVFEYSNIFRPDVDTE